MRGSIWCVAVAAGAMLPLSAARAATVSGSSTFTVTLAPGCDVQVASDLAFPTPTLTLTSGNVAFGANQDGTGIVQFVCSSGTSYSIFAPLSANAYNGQRRLKSSAGNYYVNYNISAVSTGGTAFPTASGSTSSPYSRTGTGATETVTVYGRAPAQTISDSTGGTSNVTPQAGSYSDTIAISVTF